MPIKEQVTSLGRKKQRSKEYLAMNPLGKVPCLQVCCFKCTVTSLGFLHTAVLALP